MSESIIVALITGAAAVIGNYLLQRADRARLDQKTADRLDHLEKKIDIHNGYAQRFEAIGQDITKIMTTLEFLRNM